MSAELKFNQEHVILQPKRQRSYPVQESDWKKLKTKLEECSPNKSTLLKDIALILIGSGISSFLSLVALFNSKDVANWILITNWVLFLCSIILGSCLLYLDSQQNKKLTSDINEVLREMEIIEQKYYDPNEEPLFNRFLKGLRNTE